MKCDFEEKTPGNFICKVCGWQALSFVDQECIPPVVAVQSVAASVIKPKKGCGHCGKKRRLITADDVKKQQEGLS